MTVYYVTHIDNQSINVCRAVKRASMEVYGQQTYEKTGELHEAGQLTVNVIILAKYLPAMATSPTASRLSLKEGSDIL